MKTKQVQILVYAALFTALICIATMIIQVPSFGPSGYVNLGDAFILLSVWILGGIYSPLAAGIGSALADILTGYAFYAPGTLVIKFLMALAAVGVMKLFYKKGRPSILAFILSGVIAELIMVAGYLLYEAVFLGYGLAAVPAVASNLIQGGINLVIGIVVIGVLDKSKALKKIKAF